jgi:hypothetical protein
VEKIKETYEILIVVTVIFTLSIIAALILFKVLKSTAIVKKAGYQAGGALAGFIIIFSTLYYSYESLCNKIPADTVKKDYIVKSNIQLALNVITKIKGVKVTILESDKKISEGYTDSEGVVSLTVPDAWGKQFTIKLEKEGYEEITMGATLGQWIIHRDLRPIGEK